MTVRTRDWLKFGSLVAIAFVLGLAFASSLDLPKKGGAAESLRAAQQTTAPPRTPLPGAKPIADLSEAFVAVAEHVNPALVFIPVGKTNGRVSRSPPATHTPLKNRRAHLSTPVPAPSPLPSFAFKKKNI